MNSLQIFVVLLACIGVPVALFGLRIFQSSINHRIQAMEEEAAHDELLFKIYEARSRRREENTP